MEIVRNPFLSHHYLLLLLNRGIFLLISAILIYRGFRDSRKKNLKIVHAVIHIAAFFCAVIGLVAVFDAHNSSVPPKPNLYSLHSWLGLFAVILFAAQYLFGFVFYMYGNMPQSLKISFMPLHTFFGLFGFVLCVAAALMGITETVITGIPHYENLPGIAQLFNLLGLSLAIFAGLVIFLVSDARFKRMTLPEDAMLLTGHD